MQQGALYIVSTPIGNLEDITIRALRILQEVDLIAAEDTRQTRKLLHHFDIPTPLTSYHIHNEHHKTSQLLDKVTAGTRLAVVSDAGTPGIADPGFLLIRDAVARGIEPVMIPGVSSLILAATASALPIDKFSFYGFMPVKSGKKGKLLQQIANIGHTAVVFESPHRISKTLQAVSETVGAETGIAIIREATKLHEEVIRGRAGELAEQYAGQKWRGECVIVISPRNC